ncbi:hypothetical protein BT96DRAFT_362461 [Gymnopus androsaceus JB14]|uniref:Uncharacterized protein n=1 Tax=Gymnopus androsaceus JB14 TaxID=1447944 RepID=A0A6A4GVY7_9AGAR|nr:hypothetical protein BT96DRAFT_362461 [Gymnopus androsaceus JB14]
MQRAGPDSLILSQGATNSSISSESNVLSISPIHRLDQAGAILGPIANTLTLSYGLRSLYSDLLELLRPVHSFSIQAQAFLLIMRSVGGMNFRGIAPALVNWPLSNSYDLLKEMIFCLQMKDKMYILYLLRTLSFTDDQQLIGQHG